MFGCSSESTPVADAGVLDVVATDATAAADVNFARDVRGRRYCEVLAGAVSGATVALDVYNTYGLNECPDAAWRGLTVAGLRAELGVAVVVINGPRYWTIDAFESAAVRDPTVRSAAGGRVYELIDPMSHVFVMQSYTVQREAQTEASRADLGARLQLPAGWRFRTRVLAEDLRVVAEGGLATVTTDDVGNTYQRSQQPP